MAAISSLNPASTVHHSGIDFAVETAVKRSRLTCFVCSCVFLHLNYFVTICSRYLYGNYLYFLKIVFDELVPHVCFLIWRASNYFLWIGKLHLIITISHVVPLLYQGEWYQ